MKLVFHIGTVKTGSTALQRSFSLLEREMFVVDRDLLLIVVCQLASRLAPLRGLWVKLFNVRLSGLLEKAPISTKLAIISDENFATDLRKFGTFERLEFLKTATTKYNPHILVCKRKGDGFRRSLRAELITSGAVLRSRDLDSICDDLDAKVESLLAKAQELFGPRYLEIDYSDQIVGEFWLMLGFPRFEGAKLSGRQNVSVGNPSEKTRVLIWCTQPLWKPVEGLTLFVSVAYELSSLRVLRVFLGGLRLILRKLNIRSWIVSRYKVSPA